MPNGTIIEDPVRFPSGMGALAQAVQSRGLKFGVYTSASSLTCQRRPGSYDFEAVDIERYCDLGIDYLKVDSCFGTHWPTANESWIRMRAAMDKCTGPRQVLQVDAIAACTSASGCSGKGAGRLQTLSVEYCKNGSGCASWIAGLADLWRTTGDVQANFASIMNNLDGNNDVSNAARPGKYCDPDMLLLGQPGVSLEEAQTQLGAWAVVAAPLLLSVDLTQPLPAGLLDIALNAEVIAVSQDAAQVMGVRVSPPAPLGVECWARPLAPRAGDAHYVAALLLNRGAATANASCTWEELGLPAGAAARARDTYAHSDLGVLSGSVARLLGAHESALITLAVAA
jgi:alpha-galactosidase